jgi:hypothetical protein
LATRDFPRAAAGRAAARRVERFAAAERVTGFEAAAARPTGAFDFDWVFALAFAFATGLPEDLADFDAAAGFAFRF